ncbi:MAG: hypothetical protein DWC08_07510 [Candidatus Poseidoniales archaeon]|nr:MAG: hypothetical protein DWC08_07510 [Candidatus Poseidoniales archaeon]
MGSRNRKSRTDRRSRQERARQSQQQLIEIIKSDTPNRRFLIDSTIRHLVKVSSRHRLQVPSEARMYFCRKCRTPFQYGENVRVRIKHGQRIVTCLSCSHTRRFGGGPKYHRIRRNL